MEREGNLILMSDITNSGVAIGLVSTSRLIGGAVAGAIYTSIYTNHYTSSIPYEHSPSFPPPLSCCFGIDTAFHPHFPRNRLLEEKILTPKLSRSNLFSHALAANFTGSLPSLLAASTTNTVAAYQKVAGATPEVIKAAQLAVKESYVEGFKLVFLVAIAFGILAIAAACCTRSVERAKKSNAQAARLENERGVEKVVV